MSFLEVFVEMVRVRDTILKKRKRISDNRNANNGRFGSAVRFGVEDDDEEFWKKLCLRSSDTIHAEKASNPYGGLSKTEFYRREDRKRLLAESAAQCRKIQEFFKKPEGQEILGECQDLTGEVEEDSDIEEIVLEVGDDEAAAGERRKSNIIHYDVVKLQELIDKLRSEGVSMENFENKEKVAKISKLFSVSDQVKRLCVLRLYEFIVAEILSSY